jgi:hypothetical protein
LAAALAAVLLGAATLARAENNTQATTPPKMNDFAPPDTGQNPWSIPYPHKTYAFDGKGKWGVKLDLDEPTNRDLDWKDAKVGAYVRITPKFKVSGAVGLGEKFSAQPQFNQGQHLTPDDTAPRVHLEGAFQF